MRAFAVRHKPSGLFIPRFEGNKRIGGSYLEPSDKREPRLFHNAIAARSFLGNWLQGHFFRDYFIDSSGEAISTLAVTKQPHRKKEEMEIVEFRLVEIKPKRNK